MVEAPFLLTRLAVFAAEESETSRFTEMLGMVFIALVVFGPVAFLVYYRKRRSPRDIVIDLRDRPQPDGHRPAGGAPPDTVESVLDEIEKIAGDLRSGQRSYGEAIEVYVATRLTIDGDLVDESLATSIVLDSAKRLGLLPDGFTTVTGGRLHRFRAQQPTA